MKKNYGKRVAAFVAAAVLTAISAVGTNVTPVKAAETHTVWVVGDSTVSAFSDNYYYPRYGWGTQLDKFFDDTLKVENLALSGRSSKSFTSEANYTKLIDGMQSGDFLFIGFGHNDEKAEADRYTNPNGDYKTAGSFANSLYENYIKKAQDKGVTVVLVTPIVRRTTTGEWSNSNLHITSDSGEYAGGDYSAAIKKLGQDVNVAVVDMTTLTKNLYDSLGTTGSLDLHAWTSSNSSSVDNTHTNIYGGTYNAYLITKTVKELGVTGLAEHITVAEPDKATTLVSNPDYKEAVYTPVTGKSELWADAGIFSGTAFGDLGGKPTTTNYTLALDGQNINMVVRNNKGKIASTADGVIMYYYQIPADKNFTISAKVTINAFDSNDQVSFGLMARDDMYLDTNTKDLLGDYVAAGPLKLTKGTDGWSSFARKSGVLTKGANLTKEYQAGDVVEVMIASNSDGYACTFDGQTVTGGFDFKLQKNDAEYVYVGLYAARNCDVTFSDIKLVVDGSTINVYTGEVEAAPTPTEAPTPTPEPTEAPAATEAPVVTDTPAATNTPAATEAPAEQPATKSNAPIIIPVVVLALVVCGGAVAFFITKNKKK